MRSGSWRLRAGWVDERDSKGKKEGRLERSLRWVVVSYARDLAYRLSVSLNASRRSRELCARMKPGWWRCTAASRGSCCSIAAVSNPWLITGR